MTRSTGILLFAIALLFSLTLACIPSGGADEGSESPATGGQAPTGAPAAPTSVPANPTPVPAAATPTSQAADVLEIYGGHTYQAYDYFHVVGEMLNPTNDWLEYVKIVATFYDANGTMIGTEFTYTELDVVPPEDRGVFELSVDATSLGGSVDSYELQVQARAASEMPYQDLVAEVSNQYEEYDYWHLEGLVQNTGSRDCEFVKVVGAFYDSTDTIVGVDFTYTDLDVVGAGSQSPFDLAADYLPQWDHLRIWVQGRPTAG